VYFPLRQLPQFLQAIAWALPLAHGAALARGLALGDPVGWPWLSVGVLVLYAAAGIVAATWLARRRLMK